MTQPTDDQYHHWQSIANEELIYIDPDTLLRFRNFIINDLDDNPEIPNQISDIESISKPI